MKIIFQIERNKNMFSGLLQPLHLIVILAIVLIIFGPGKLPDLGNSLGKAIKSFKNEIKETEKESDDTSEIKKIEGK